MDTLIGRIEVRDIFTIPAVGTLAGCMVLEGRIKQNSRLRVFRDGVLLHKGCVGSLRRFKEDVTEVRRGFECGLGIDGYDDLRVDDVIEIFATAEQQGEKVDSAAQNWRYRRPT